MTDKITFTLDGREVEAEPGETIWQVAQRQRHQYPAPVLASGTRLSRRRQLPRLHGRGRRRARAGRLLPEQGRRRHEGEDGERAGEEVARDGVRAADGRPARARDEPRSRLQVLELGRCHGRHADEPLPEGSSPRRPTCTHSAIAVNLDACINCGLCVRACREVQANDVIGMAYPRPRLQGRVRFRPGHGAVDLRRLRRVRAGVPDGRADGEEPARRGRHARQLRDQLGRHAVPLLRRRLPDHGARQGREDPLRRRPRRARPTTTACASRAASASTTSITPIA